MTRALIESTKDAKRPIEFKLMPNGSVRGFRPNRSDKPGDSEWQIILPYCIAHTLTSTHCSKILIADNNIYGALQRVKFS